jgi:hypothetical protein
MEYLIWPVTGCCIGSFSALIGLDRDRSFYATVLMGARDWKKVFVKTRPG